MATSKTKGTSKKIKQLKGIKPEKISEEQLKKVQENVNNINRIHNELGSIESKKHDLLHYLSSVKDIMSELQIEFQKEYGTYDINISDGTINYEKENGEVNKKD